MSRSITKRQEQARELRMQKMSLREIGEKLGISKQGALYLIIAGDKYSDIQISTLERWLKTGRINRVYAKVVKERLNIT